jgi:hypothetical protein
MQSSLEHLLVYFPSCNISPTTDALVNKISMSFAEKDSQRLTMLAVRFNMSVRIMSTWDW